MRLVSEEELSRLRQKHIREYHPTVAAMANIQGDVSRVLGRNDLSTEQKLALISAGQARFQRLRASLPQSIWTAPSLGTATPAAAATTARRADATTATDAAPAPIQDVAMLAPVAPTTVATTPAHRMALMQTDAPSDDDTDEFKDPMAQDVKIADPELLEMTKHETLFDKIVNKHPDIIRKANNGEVQVNGMNIAGSSYDDLSDILYAAIPKPNLTGLNEFMWALYNKGFRAKDAQNPSAAKYFEQIAEKVKSQEGQPSPRQGRAASAALRKAHSSTGQSGKGRRRPRRKLYVVQRGRSPPGRPAKALKLYH